MVFKMPQHSSLTEEAKKIAKILKRNGITPHPGVINPQRNRNGFSITLIISDTRNTLKITGNGTQEIHLYNVSEDKIKEILSSEFNLVVKDMRTNHNFIA